MKYLFTVKTLHDLGATLLGLLVAIASAYMTIDWSSFDIKKEWPKLVLSAIIAAGGYFSTIKKKDSTNVGENKG